jgi:hypothetical protein
MNIPVILPKVTQLSSMLDNQRFPAVVVIVSEDRFPGHKSIAHAAVTPMGELLALGSWYQEMPEGVVSAADLDWSHAIDIEPNLFRMNTPWLRGFFGRSFNARGSLIEVFRAILLHAPETFNEGPENILAAQNADVYGYFEIRDFAIWGEALLHDLVPQTPARVRAALVATLRSAQPPGGSLAATKQRLEGRESSAANLVDRSPDRPLSWSREEYQKFLATEWETLLNRNPSEKELQSFLECHPSLVPGAYICHHGPIDRVLWTQPRLAGYTGKVPDFMWLTSTSDVIKPVFIEIEDPAKPIFTKAGVFHSDFTQAKSQISDWMRWFKNHGNVQAFRTVYGLVSRSWVDHEIEPEFILIYGRRSNIPPENVGKRHLEQRANEHIMTYDRLHIDSRLLSSNCLTGTRRTPVVKQVSPIFGTGLHLLENKLLIEASGLEQAIDNNSLITAERKIYLKERLTFWRDLADQELPIMWDAGQENIE